MRIPDIKKLVFNDFLKVPQVILYAVMLPLCGCNIVGFLASPGPFEKKIPPKYDLVAQQERKILLLVECPRSSGVDFDIKTKLTNTMKIYLTGHMGIEPENLLASTPEQDMEKTHDPVKEAVARGAGYVLVLHVDNYSLRPLNTRNYYVGELRSRVILLDADLGEPVWPQDPRGELVHVGVDLETEGREMAVTRLLSATAHCALRELYPCEKLTYKNSDEVMTLQDAIEMETY